MSAAVTPTQTTDQKALRLFLLDLLPDGTEVIIAQANRVPEPRSDNFVVMTPLRFQRMRTNIDSDEDVAFTASMLGTTMTVTAVEFGAIAVGATVFGTGVAAGTKVTALGSGTGGVGTYTISQAQTVASRQMASGAKTMEQGAMVVTQLDFHSRDNSSSNMAQIVSTAFRDSYATEFFEAQGLGVVPLYADDPRQRPFMNDQQQAEWRWSLEAAMQVNNVVSVPQQYADSIEVDVISVEAEYPV